MLISRETIGLQDFGNTFFLFFWLQLLNIYEHQICCAFYSLCKGQHKIITDNNNSRQPIYC